MLNKPGAKEQAAYQRAKAAKGMAYLQGLRGEPLSGDALLGALIAGEGFVFSNQNRLNVYVRAYLIGWRKRDSRNRRAK